MTAETPNSIQFLFADPNRFPHPVPAAQCVPDWLKQMPADVMCTQTTPPGPAGSVKKCMPFVDAMASGYVIPLAGDVTFRMTAPGQLNFTHSDDVISSQDNAQVVGSPFANMPLVKFRNPWVIQTPPGYSTLFLPILNQFAVPFQILAGLVDTDTFYMQVFFPSVCLMQPGQEFTMKKGMPLVQAIPIRRESWVSTVGTWDAARVTAVNGAVNANPHEYRDEYWQKKNYR